MSKNHVLQVKNLQVRLPLKQQWIHAVNTINFSIAKGEIFALVGESGSGKSMTAMSITRLLPLQAQMVEGSEIWLGDTPIHGLSEHEMQHVRSKKIGMIFQDPMASLNPVLSIGEQLVEAILSSSDKKISYKQKKTEAELLLKQVRIPDPEKIFYQYPHQLSGGMKQRVVIAMALAKKPDLLIADEPTTALDVTTQAQVLHLIQSLNESHQIAILLITHDLGIVAQLADKIAVMYAGHLIEQSNAQDFFKEPLHPYSKKLLNALPEKSSQDHALAVIPGQVPSLTETFSLCRFKSRCELKFKPCEELLPGYIKIGEDRRVRCHWYDENILTNYPKDFHIKNIEAEEEKNIIVDEGNPELSNPDKLVQLSDFKVYYPIKKGILKRTVGYIRAVDGIDLVIHEGETVALVGESGCGKTSVGKSMLRLIDSTGHYHFDSIDMLNLSNAKLRKKRSEFQMIFQDPYSSMNPKMRVNDILQEGMLSLKVGTDSDEREDRVNVLLEQVGLSPEMKWRYPFEFSGGQRQRIAIARALSVGPRLIICDEPTSALDVSVQAQILNLLKTLQIDIGVSLLFITHNLNVVRYIAHRIAVMYLGKIVEVGLTDDILSSPKHPYTQALLSSVPSTENLKSGFLAATGEVPSLLRRPKGCHFAPRCPHKMNICEQSFPKSYSVDEQHEVSCYLHEKKE